MWLFATPSDSSKPNKSKLGPIQIDIGELESIIRAARAKIRPNETTKDVLEKQENIVKLSKDFIRTVTKNPNCMKEHYSLNIEVKETKSIEIPTTKCEQKQTGAKSSKRTDYKIIDATIDPKLFSSDVMKSFGEDKKIKKLRVICLVRVTEKPSASWKNSFEFLVPNKNQDKHFTSELIEIQEVFIEWQEENTDGDSVNENDNKNKERVKRDKSKIPTAKCKQNTSGPVFTKLNNINKDVFEIIETNSKTCPKSDEYPTERKYAQTSNKQFSLEEDCKVRNEKSTQNCTKMNRSKLLSKRHSEINKQIENVSKNEETKTRCEENPGDVDHQLFEKEATTQMKDSQITTPFNIDSADDNSTCTLSTEYSNGNDALVKSNLTMDNNNDKVIAKEEQPPLFDYFTTSNETCEGKESEKHSFRNTMSDTNTNNTRSFLKCKIFKKLLNFRQSSKIGKLDKKNSGFSNISIESRYTEEICKTDYEITNDNETDISKGIGLRIIQDNYSSTKSQVSGFDSINSNDSLKDKHDCIKVVNILTSKLNPEELEAMKCVLKENSIHLLTLLKTIPHKDSSKQDSQTVDFQKSRTNKAKDHGQLDSPLIKGDIKDDSESIDKQSLKIQTDSNQCEKLVASYEETSDHQTTNSKTDTTQKTSASEKTKLLNKMFGKKFIARVFKSNTFINKNKSDEKQSSEQNPVGCEIKNTDCTKEHKLINEKLCVENSNDIGMGDREQIEKENEFRTLSKGLKNCNMGDDNKEHNFVGKFETFMRKSKPEPTKKSKFTQNTSCYDNDFYRNVYSTYNSHAVSTSNGAVTSPFESGNGDDPANMALSSKPIRIQYPGNNFRKTRRNIQEKFYKSHSSNKKHLLKGKSTRRKKYEVLRNDEKTTSSCYDSTSSTQNCISKKNRGKSRIRQQVSGKVSNLKRCSRFENLSVYKP